MAAKKVVSGHTDPLRPTTPARAVGMLEQQFHLVFEGESETQEQSQTRPVWTETSVDGKAPTNLTDSVKNPDKTAASVPSNVLWHIHSTTEFDSF